MEIPAERMESMLARCGVLFLVVACLPLRAAGEDAQPPQPQATTPTVEAPQPEPGPPVAGALARDFLRDQRAIWTSPLHVTRGQAARVALFGIVTAGLIATDSRTSNALPNTRDQIAVGNAISHIGAAYSTLGLAGGMLFIGRATHDDHLAETGFLGAEALADTLAVAGVLKLVTSRERPDVDSGHGHFWAGGASFPSGHAIMSWGLAEVIASEYDDRPLVRIGACGLAGLVSLSRVTADKHFFSDVFAGGAAGFLIGRYVYRTHHDPQAHWSLRPLVQFNPSTRTYAAGLLWVRP